MRIKCTVSYDGSQFYGYQVQPGQRTVQGEIEQALSEVHKGRFVRITASGRTDAGVHAMGQVFHFDTDLQVPAAKWPVILNQKIGDDIAILSAEEAPDTFHARFDVKTKEYRYIVNTSPVALPFRRHYAVHYPYTVDIEAMRKAAAHLEGEHDFTSFSSAKTEVIDRVRTIDFIKIEEFEDELIFRVKGNGFLYNMVRIIAGTLLEVGNGKYEPEEVVRMLEAKDRSAAGKTAPAHGLYLWEVNY
ncbi:tRNA pseudouridine(38-40) synthase TruA [Jeotgalibacillus haloalkalitolerans]|uniref:tRNA pseudouridine synthase A n=1 Tax=Jeotgalibacillus haloalkalitolerans TaxID=3104292 RepID=A0ABU5KR37_9BACL|nr:tRNA pseudouridine(38-40) synthase TruA [Jeotgalibacillus sp. HH7-29]MDZ5713694.1 tRNA pseudouridine(38-40) synthase TruA [Jeotgalibacillus sp. HH7-29]